MRHLFIILISLFFLSCQSTTENSKSNQSKTHLAQKNGNKFFSYDSILYFSSNLHDSLIVKIDANRSKSLIDSIKRNVIIGNIPKDITDLSFINFLSEIGYQKRNIDKSKFIEIDSIFIEKLANDTIMTICPRIYRDILVFKIQNKIVGVAKICFTCGENKIVGTQANTVNFGKDGDYNKLQNILKN